MASKAAKDASDWALKRKQAIANAALLREENRVRMALAAAAGDDDQQLKPVPKGAAEFQDRLQGGAPPWAMHEDVDPAPRRGKHRAAAAVSPPWAVIEEPNDQLPPTQKLPNNQLPPTQKLPTMRLPGQEELSEENGLSRTLKLWEHVGKQVKSVLYTKKQEEGPQDPGTDVMIQAKRDLQDLKARRASSLKKGESGRRGSAAEKASAAVKEEARRREAEDSARAQAEMAAERAKREAHRRGRREESLKRVPSAGRARAELAERQKEEARRYEELGRVEVETSADRVKRESHPKGRREEKHVPSAGRGHTELAERQKEEAKRLEAEGSARVQAEMAAERAKREAHKRGRRGGGEERRAPSVNREPEFIERQKEEARRREAEDSAKVQADMAAERAKREAHKKARQDAARREAEAQSRTAAQRAQARQQAEKHPPVEAAPAWNAPAGHLAQERRQKRAESTDRGPEDTADEVNRKQWVVEASELPSWARKAVSKQSPPERRRRKSAKDPPTRPTPSPTPEPPEQEPLRRNSMVDRLREGVNSQGGSRPKLRIDCDSFKARPTSTPPPAEREAAHKALEGVSRPASAMSTVRESTEPLASPAQRIKAGKNPPQPKSRARAVANKAPAPAAHMPVETRTEAPKAKPVSKAVKVVAASEAAAAPASPAQKIKASQLAKQQGQIDPRSLLVKEQANPVNKTDDNDPITRQMFDKRHSRRMNREAFMAAIAKWRPPVLAAAGRVADPGAADRSVSLYIRKRPLFGYESSKGEFDVVSVVQPKDVVLHSCQMHADMKRMHVKRTTFGFDGVFNEYAENDAVFEGTAKPLVYQVAHSGGLGTIFMFGQTGSGKTFTMEALHASSVELLFSLLPPGTELQLSMYELAGKKVLDLMDERKPQLQIVDRGKKAVEVQGAISAAIRSTEEAMFVIGEANNRRATAGTDINAGSSRSHSVVELRAPNGGRLTMVDCAGTERKEDSMYHSSERRKEGAEINASLYALKECMRSLRQQMRGGAHVHVPYRSSSLTKVLMESFVRDDARIAVICTVSPASTDTEHSLATLRTASMLMGRDGGEPEEVEAVEAVNTIGTQLADKLKEQKPSGWDHDQLVEWISGLQGRLASGAEAVHATVDGKAILRWPKTRFKSLYEDNSRLGDELFQVLHAKVKISQKEVMEQRKNQRKAIAKRVAC